MSRTIRMTEAEYLETKRRILELEADIKPTINEIRGLKRRVYWYEYSDSTLKDHTTDYAVKMFGKRFKDLTAEEKREYKRTTTRMYREKAREGK